MLTIRNSRDVSGQWRSGGAGWATASQTYGRWETRLRYRGAPGHSAAALLWPQDNKAWPPEIDYFEVGRDMDSSKQMLSSNHYLLDGVHKISQAWHQMDFTQWHTFVVEWTPTRVDLFIDGVLVQSEHEAARIPRIPMWAGFQTHVERFADGSFAPDLAGAEMDVDYVRISRYGG